MAKTGSAKGAFMPHSKYFPLTLNNFNLWMYRVNGLVTFFTACIVLMAVPIITTSSFLIGGGKPPVSLEVNHVKL